MITEAQSRCQVCGETAPTDELCLLRITGNAQPGKPCGYSMEGRARLRSFLEEQSAAWEAENAALSDARTQAGGMD